MADASDGPEETDNNSEQKLEKKCLHCKRSITDSLVVRCIKCKKVCHEGCTTRNKNFKTITSEVGLCCYANDVLHDMIFLTTLIIENEAKTTEIKLLRKINTELEEKNALLQEKIKTNTEEILVRETYASATAAVGNQSRTEARQPKNLPSIIIKPKINQNIEETKAKVYALIKPKEIGVGINNTKTTRHGSIIIKCSTKDETNKLQEEAIKKIGADYEVETTKLRLPKIRIPGYTGNMDKAEIEESFRVQNKFINSEDSIKVTYIKGNKDKSKTIYVECSSQLFIKLVTHQKIYLGWDRLRVYEDLSIPRCYNCQEYYHKSNQCNNRKICAKCTGEHDTRNCHSTQKTCHNCTVTNRKYNTEYNVNHESGSQQCPTLEYHQKQLKTKIDYGTYG